MVSNLVPNRTYNYQVRTLGSSGASQYAQFTVKTPQPFLGLQADHTLQYTYEGTEPPKELNLPTYPVGDVMAVATSNAIHAWHSASFGVDDPNIKICRVGQCGNRKDDGRTVSIKMRKSFTGVCGHGWGCVRTLSDQWADDDGYLHNLELLIKGPYRTVPSKDRHETISYLWTAEIGEDNEPVANNDEVRWKYLTDIMMHELGHALGLDHYPSGSALMHARKLDLHDSIPQVDQDYLESIYRNHTPIVP